MIGKEPCPCGHRACKKWFLTGIGDFVQGSGFTEEEADRIVDAVNNIESERDQKGRIAEQCMKLMGHTA